MKNCNKKNKRSLPLSLNMCLDLTQNDKSIDKSALRHLKQISSLAMVTIIIIGFIGRLLSSRRLLYSACFVGTMFYRYAANSHTFRM